ncbi:hypothetical protein AB0910_21845 [Streptomyces sp. NPDC047002]|uniref:hypothetical protein n=1 Tax=Streptomyces sp. NPDC047002 TaxID=3155475 RepID=UPI0034514526
MKQKTAGRPVSWATACDGIISADMRAHLAKGANAGLVPEDTVYETGSRSGKRQVAQVAKDLAAEPRGTEHEGLCKLRDRDGKDLVSVAFYWAADDFPRGQGDSQNVVTEVDKNFKYMTDKGRQVLGVNCASTGGDEETALLHGMVDGNAAFDERSAIQMLYAAVSKILPDLRCTNGVTVPTRLPYRDPRMK